MLGVLRGLFASRPSGADEVCLSFRLGDEHADAPEIQNGFKMVGKGRRGNLYSIGRRLNPSEERVAIAAKRHVIEAQINGSDSRSAIQDAYAKALAFVGGYNVQSKELIAYMVAHDTSGSGPFSMLLEDSDNIEEIVVNRPDSNLSIYHTGFGFCTTNISFRDEGSLRLMLNKLIMESEKELSSKTPIIDAQLENGSRVHAQLSPYSVNGATVSIRLNRENKMDLKRLLALGTLSPEITAYLWLAIESDMNLVISGAPASGKTSLLLALASLFPSYNRAVIIEEDASELRLGTNFINVVNLQSRRNSKVGLKDQVINALHIRPDRLIIGELRGGEAREVFSAGNLGIPFMTTMHSGSDGDSLINRLTSRPMGVEADSISALDIAVLMEKDDSSRKIRRICEYRWVTKNETGIDKTNPMHYAINEVFSGNASDQDSVARSKVIERYAEQSLISIPKAVSELRRRTRFIKGMGTAASVSDYIRSYGA